MLVSALLGSAWAHQPVTFLLLLFLTGCGSDSPHADGGRGAPPAAGGELVSQAQGGNLMGLVRSMATARIWAADCDNRDQHIREQIAAVLDARRDEMTAYVAAHAEGASGYRRVLHGPLTIREPLETARPVDRWNDEAQESWPEVLAEYNRVRELPMNSAWVRFNDHARSLISDDESRMLWQLNMQIHREDVPLLLRLERTLSACAAQSDCAAPALASDLISFMHRNEDYASVKSRLDLAADFAERRNIIVSWASWVEADAAFYHFTPHVAVRRVSQGKIELHLDPGVLGEAAGRIKATIEGAWHSRRLGVEVVWRPGGYLSDAQPYLLQFSPEVGSRASVNNSHRIMHVYDDVRLTAFAHEAGHILGFPDHYYTRFESSQCRYYVESNDADLMSSSDTGHVLEADFLELDGQYPVN